MKFFIRLVSKKGTKTPYKPFEVIKRRNTHEVEVDTSSIQVGDYICDAEILTPDEKWRFNISLDHKRSKTHLDDIFRFRKGALRDLPEENKE